MTPLIYSPKLIIILNTIKMKLSDFSQNLVWKSLIENAFLIWSITPPQVISILTFPIMKNDSFLLFIILFLVSEEINSNENDCCSSSLKPFHATGPFLYTGLFQSSTQHLIVILNPLSANFTKWSNTLNQFVGKLPLFGKLP